MEKLAVITKFCGESIGPDHVRTVYAGEEDFTQTHLEQKNILLFGSHESGKNEIIDAFCNIIYGITFDSLIRYKIANERFDSSIKDNSIVKYVFYGTKFQFIPVIIDIPDIGDPKGLLQQNSYTLLRNFVNYDCTAQIHSLVITLPANPSFSRSIESQYSEILSLFSPSLRKSIISISNFIENDTNASNLFLQQIGILPFKKFYTNTCSLFTKPSLDASIREKQMRNFDLTVQNLTLLVLNLGRAESQAISNLSGMVQDRPSSTPPRYPPAAALPPRPRPTSVAQNRPMTIPSTIHEVKEDVSLTSTPTYTAPQIPTIQLRSNAKKNQPRPSSFQETEDRIQIVKSKVSKDIYSSEQALAPPKSVIYGSQPIGLEVVPVGNTLPSENESGYVQAKRYLYDPTTRTYQMYFVRERCSNTSGSQTLPATISSSPVPRVISPAHGIRKGDVRQEMKRLIRGSLEDIEASPTESSEQSSGYLQRGGIESARSTASEWKYTPSNKGTLQHTTTLISESSEPLMNNHVESSRHDIPHVSGYSYDEPRTLWRQQLPPPKPARAVDPEFGHSEEEGFQRAVQIRQTRKRLSNSQRRAIKSHPQQGQELQIYSGYPEFDTDEVEYAENVPLNERSYRPNQEIYQQKVPIKQGWGQQMKNKRFSYPPQQHQRNPYAQIPSSRPAPRNLRSLRASQGPPGRRRRQKQTTFDIEETSERSHCDCTKCCFYVLAPIFIISAIIAVVVTLILSAR